MNQDKKFNVLLGGFICAVVILLVVGIRIGENPNTITDSRMLDLEEAILDWVLEKGQPPKTLEELGLPDEALVDHIGTPFVYSTDGSKVSITSLGGDRKKGGIMFKADKTVSFDTD